MSMNQIAFPKSWLKRILLLGLLFIFISVITTYIWFANLDISKLSEPLPKPTLIYDINGQLATKFDTAKINPVTIEQIPQQLKDAVIATEDRRFYDHSGVDTRSILRALWRDIRSQSFAEGGSTITQQLAKNMF